MAGRAAKKEDKQGELIMADLNVTKTAVLVASFGTSYNDTRERTIGAIEREIAQRFPQCEHRRAFTSEKIIAKLFKRDGTVIDNVPTALEKLLADGFKKVVVQPTHIMPGYEYDDVKNQLKPFAERFDRLILGRPLLDSESDFERVVSVMALETSRYNTYGTAIVLMGHGTGHEANAVYSTLQGYFDRLGHKNYIIGAVEGEPTIREVVKKAKAMGVRRVILLPLMVVAGAHANEDMAGDGDDSWKSILQREGFETVCILSGMGEYDGIRRLFADHADKALSVLQ